MQRMRSNNLSYDVFKRSFTSFNENRIKEAKKKNGEKKKTKQNLQTNIQTTKN